VHRGKSKVIETHSYLFHSFATDFLIERQGAFIMLMLGECILSLVVVAYSFSQIGIVFPGIVLVTWLFFLKFESE
jgi:hypothetical protein